VATNFPTGAHVRENGIIGQTDEDIGLRPGHNGFVSDPRLRLYNGHCYGAQTKFIWLRLVIATRTQLLALLLKHLKGTYGVRHFKGNGSGA